MPGASGPGALRAFEAAVEVEGAQRMHEVNVGVVEGKVQGAAKEGGVEALAVVGNQQVVGGDVVVEMVEVLPVDIVVEVAAVVEDDGGDVVVGPPSPVVSMSRERHWGGKG